MRMKMMTAMVLALGLQAAPAMADEMMEQAIQDNIRPVGSVAVAGESSSAAAANEPAAMRAGVDVYNASCMACHATGAAGAPKVGDKAAWAPRADQGIDVLLDHATNGLNAMPPKGTCGDCAADELKAAIEHMLSETGLL